MFNKLFAFIVITGLCCAAVPAQEQKGPSLADWLKVVQKKIDKIATKKIAPLSGGSEGIRGTKEEASVRLYWKGKRNDDPVSEEEMNDFKIAIGLVARGKQAAAITGLEKFLAQYPDSALIPDAKKTLDLVKAEKK